MVNQSVRTLAFTGLSAFALTSVIALQTVSPSMAAPPEGDAEQVCQVFNGDEHFLTIWQENDSSFFGEYVSGILANTSNASSPIPLTEQGRQATNTFTFGTDELNPEFTGYYVISQGIVSSPPAGPGEPMGITLQHNEPSFYESATFSGDSKTLTFIEDIDYATDSSGNHFPYPPFEPLTIDEAASVIEFRFTVDPTVSGTVTIDHNAKIPESVWRQGTNDWGEFNPDTDYVFSAPLSCSFEIIAQSTGTDPNGDGGDGNGGTNTSPTPPDKVDTAAPQGSPVGGYFVLSFGLLLFLVFGLLKRSETLMKRNTNE